MHPSAQLTMAKGMSETKCTNCDVEFNDGTHRRMGLSCSHLICKNCVINDNDECRKCKDLRISLNDVGGTEDDLQNPGSAANDHCYSAKNPCNDDSVSMHEENSSSILTQPAIEAEVTEYGEMQRIGNDSSGASQRVISENHVTRSESEDVDEGNSESTTPFNTPPKKLRLEVAASSSSNMEPSPPVLSPAYSARSNADIDVEIVNNVVRRIAVDDCRSEDSPPVLYKYDESPKHYMKTRRAAQQLDASFPIVSRETIAAMVSSAQNWSSKMKHGTTRVRKASKLKNNVVQKKRRRQPKLSLKRRKRVNSAKTRVLHPWQIAAQELPQCYVLVQRLRRKDLERVKRNGLHEDKLEDNNQDQPGVSSMELSAELNDEQEETVIPVTETIANVIECMNQVSDNAVGSAEAMPDCGDSRVVVQRVAIRELSQERTINAKHNETTVPEKLTSTTSDVFLAAKDRGNAEINQNGTGKEGRENILRGKFYSGRASGSNERRRMRSEVIAVGRDVFLIDCEGPDQDSDNDISDNKCAEVRTCFKKQDTKKIMKELEKSTLRPCQQPVNGTATEPREKNTEQMVNRNCEGQSEVSNGRTTKRAIQDDTVDSQSSDYEDFDIPVVLDPYSAQAASKQPNTPGQQRVFSTNGQNPVIVKTLIVPKTKNLTNSSSSNQIILDQTTNCQYITSHQTSSAVITNQDTTKMVNQPEKLYKAVMPARKPFSPISTPLTQKMVIFKSDENYDYCGYESAQSLEGEISCELSGFCISKPSIQYPTTKPSVDTMDKAVQVIPPDSILTDLGYVLKMEIEHLRDKEASVQLVPQIAPQPAQVTVFNHPSPTPFIDTAPANPCTQNIVQHYIDRHGNIVATETFPSQPPVYQEVNPEIVLPTFPVHQVTRTSTEVSSISYAHHSRVSQHHVLQNTSQPAPQSLETMVQNAGWLPGPTPGTVLVPYLIIPEANNSQTGDGTQLVVFPTGSKSQPQIILKKSPRPSKVGQDAPKQTIPLGRITDESQGDSSVDLANAPLLNDSLE